jgi:hypothetical protein
MQIPAIIGPNAALGKFSNAATLTAFIKAAMPFWKPGSLTDQETWQITAFLLRENGISYAGQLNDSTADQILLSSSQPTPTPTPLPAPLSPALASSPVIWIPFLLIFLLGGILFLWHTLRRRQTQP